jgi:uncharacterized protein
MKTSKAVAKLFSQQIQFNAGNEKLVGETIVCQPHTRPQLMFLHGAGQATKERGRPLTEAIVETTGLGAFLFDFSGHGGSSGALSESSLKKRTEEAEVAWQFLAKDKPQALFAFSMGGHIALELLKHHQVETLVLFYPGVYTRQAFDLPFDGRFSAEIRKDQSWRDASVFDNLRSFTGNLLIVYGENDVVVPKEIITLIYDAAANAAHKELYIIPNVPHLLLPTVYQDPDLMRQVQDKIHTALSSLVTYNK